MARVIAIKAVYVRSTKSYSTEVVVDANPLLAHNGFLVFNDGDEASTIEKIKYYKLIPSLSPAKREAIVAKLNSLARNLGGDPSVDSSATPHPAKRTEDV